MNSIQEKIEKVDDTLSILRDGWMEAAPVKKASWMAKINEQLEERWQLMEILRKINR